MTLPWAFAAGFLYFEIGILFLFCLPFISPRRWNKIFSSRIIATVFEYGNVYFNVIISVMAVLLIGKCYVQVWLGEHCELYGATSLEAAGEEPETASKGEDEINEELKKLHESLEEKSKKLAERTQELEKTKLDLAALKEQASGLTREYDRLLEEHSKAQAKLELGKDEPNTEEDKKDN
ncbi:PREDICTED: B-cell receptor-associated protein 31-like [Acropora digitifera]|uniref:B-cell receptor-associated protein 31-like n=1 Tax=Acropora digitifera TaxID=70779 RepID=UPI00077A4B99|nr:PREDICTED: B-cell receptor-associated protein 31-like [Acropora digitifera]